MGLQNNANANSSLAAYSSNALCNLIEFSEQRFLRDEFNAGSIGNLANGNSTNSSILAAAAHQQQLNQQLIQHQQHHLQQQFQQHFLQNLSPNLSVNIQAHQQSINNNSNKNGLQVNSSPGSNCSSPDAISQLSSTIKSEDHSSNHSYLSEIRDNAIDKVRLLNQLNPIEIALNARVQKQLAEQKTTSLNKNELKFSVRSILNSEDENLQNSITSLIDANQSEQNTISDRKQKTSNSTKKDNDNVNNDKIKSNGSTALIKQPKKERIESPNKFTVKTSESFSSSSSSTSSSPLPQNNHNVTSIQQQPNHHDLKANQQQSTKTIERRLIEKEIKGK